MAVFNALTRGLAIASFLGLGMGQVTLGNLDPCGVLCFDQMVKEATGLGCEGGSMDCLCTKPDFGYGARDCAIQSCGEQVAAQVTELVSITCATDSQPPPPPSPTQSPAAEKTDTEEQEAAETASSETKPTTKPAERPTPGQAPQSTISEDANTSETSVATRDPAEITSPTSLPLPGDITEESKESADEEGQATGFASLSLAAKAGIGVSVAFVFVFIVSLAAFLLFRRHGKKARRKQTYHISDPLPGSGRDFGDSHSDIKEYSMTELEMRSRRYEDMLPRTQPNVF